MHYFMMECEGKHPIMPIARGPTGAGVGFWRRGVPLTVTVTPPLVYTLDTDYPGNPQAMYDKEWVPVMRDDVIETLRKAGVDNIEYYDAILENPLTGQQLRNYKTFNIIGVVSVADIDGQLLFRLDENPRVIVVRESVRKAIEAAGIPGFFFDHVAHRYGRGEWFGLTHR